ncbi:hypothetical protein GCM10010306_055870 [Streptomyces umbrinus]|nr:hypothetical protein GCM10010306_055870 [Streptomyces umbrinus]GHH57078.1 hypothetical protein GCM10018775_64510 [Streptomyces umbrinus]
MGCGSEEGTCGPAGAVSTVAKGYSRSARGAARAGVTREGSERRSRESTPRRIPDFNRLPPLADGLRRNFPRPRELAIPVTAGRLPTGGSPPAYQSLLDEELDMNFRTT